jgi:hypothetical protein
VSNEVDENVVEGVESESETSVSDASDAREPGELADQAAEVMAVAEEPEAAVVLSESERRAEIKRGMAVNSRAKVARRDALRKEGVPTLEIGVNPNRSDDGAE